MHPLIHLFSFLLLVMTVACNKEKLQEPPNNAYAVPQSLEDLQQLLDHEQLFCQTPSGGIESGGELYVKDNLLKLVTAADKRLYGWEKDIYDEETTVLDWNIPYEQVFYANQVLARLTKMKDDQLLYPVVKGRALFMRAYAFHNLSQLYAPPYDSALVNSPFGIPLPLTGNVHAPIVRSTVGATYQQIRDDLVAAEPLLPAAMDMAHRNRPSKAAVWALLARLYLSMRQYAAALDAAERGLQLYAALIDYSTLDTTTINPFSATNAETLYQSCIRTESFAAFGFATALAGVDSLLYRSYEPGDLRQVIYFQWDPRQEVALLKSSYYGENRLFTGLTTAELMLVRAECRARQGAVTAGLADLNTLREKRWQPQEYIPLYTTDAKALLAWILVERQKELLLRGQRWSDLRRLHLEPGGPSTTLTRLCEGQLRTLPPNDARYTLPLPPRVVKENQLQQNPR